MSTEYPKVIYRRVGSELESVTVNDAEEERKIKGWTDSSPTELGFATQPSQDQIGKFNPMTVADETEKSHVGAEPTGVPK